VTPDEIDRESQEAIARWQADTGDHEAFARILQLHEKFVLRIVARKFQRQLDDPHVLEVAQDCWVELLERLKIYEKIPGKRFRSWLALLVRNRFLKARRDRRAGIGKKLVPMEKDLDVAPNVAPPEVLVGDMSALEKELEQALAQLPAEQREVLRLRNEDKKSFKEIARLLGIPLGTAQDRFYAAVEKLKPIYKKYCVR